MRGLAMVKTISNMSVKSLIVIYICFAVMSTYIPLFKWNFL